MSYAIMRCKKLAALGSVAASMQHCFRERETHNADQERTPDNQHLGAKSTDEAMGKLRADQTSYAGCVADLGLERGIEGSKATHQTIQQHYAAVERGVKPLAVITAKAVEPRVLRKGLFSSDVETPEAVAERLSRAVNEGFAGAIATASTANQERRRAKEMQDTANELRKRLETLQAAFKGLTKDQVKEVLRVAMTFQHENARSKDLAKTTRREEKSKRAPDRGL